MDRRLLIFLVWLFTGWTVGAMASGTGPVRPAGELRYPWAGGVNSCQFSALDLNLDGVKDLLLFDRHGNRALTFLHPGIPNSTDYTLDVSFAGRLPDLHDWVIAADFDCDGKTDLFTYGNAGVRVFRNISDTTLKFTLITDLLESFYYTGKVGILVTTVDYPAVEDIDGDGDLDLLTFFGLGSYVEYHRNLSMEKYGHCDSLDFRLEDPCWGKFRESESGNRITLNSGCDEGRGTKDEGRRMRDEGRHTGSTLLATDLNGDGMKDLVLGDVDYPGLVALYNGGTPDSAHMVAMDTLFPLPDPVHLFSFPAVSRLDLDHDGRNDLLVSPFDPSLHTADNYHCILFYRNTGTEGLPVYERQPGTPFRGGMMDFGSASHPVLFDLDRDGLQDLLVGNYGLYDSSDYPQAVLHSYYTSRIAWFRNTGSVTTPVFSFVTGDLAGLSQYGLVGLYPAPGDVNGDGITDLVVGQKDSTLLFFRGKGLVQGIPAFDPPVSGWQGLRIGKFCTPQLFDLDNDGLTDLVAGRQEGRLSFYRNTGTATDPAFTFVTHYLGGVDVTNYAVSWDGFSTPCLAREPGEETILVVGSDEGRIRLFGEIDGNVTGIYTEKNGLYTWLSATPTDTLFGWQTSPSVGALTDAGEFDLITGNFAGGLNYLTRRTPAVIVPGTEEAMPAATRRLRVIPNPADRSVTITPGWSTGDPVTCILADLTGREIRTFTLRGSILLDVSDLPSGLYLLRAGSSAARLIVLHP